MNTLKIDLDNPAELASYDPSGMLSAIYRFPQQVSEALEIGMGDVKLPGKKSYRAVVVAGMGGSGISGDVVSQLADGMGVPVQTVRGYTLPAYVDDRTLFFAVSYSGNTEETLECMEQACRRRSQVVAVSSGGRLSALAEERGLPLFRIPGGLQPRASLGYLFVPILAAMERTGLVDGLVKQVEGAVAMLAERSEEYSVETPLDDNPTKRLASELLGFLPIVYGSEGYLSVAAQRWKTQFNENGKIPSFYNNFSELNHNETVGWEHLEDLTSRFYLIVLREKDEHPRIASRIDITMELVRENLGHVTQVYARGSNRAERLLDLIYFGDFTSVYLALAEGQDPTPVSRIEELKKRLAHRGP